MSADEYREDIECSCYKDGSHGDYAPPEVHLNCGLCLYVLTQEQINRMGWWQGRQTIFPPGDPRIGKYGSFSIGYDGQIVVPPMPADQKFSRRSTFARAFTRFWTRDHDVKVGQNATGTQAR